MYLTHAKAHGEEASVYIAIHIMHTLDLATYAGEQNVNELLTTMVSIGIPALFGRQCPLCSVAALPHTVCIADRTLHDHGIGLFGIKDELFPVLVDLTFLSCDEAGSHNDAVSAERHSSGESAAVADSTSGDYRY